jgi:hypothetical protein
MNSTGKAPDYIRHTYKVNELKKLYGLRNLDVKEVKNLLTDIRVNNFQGNLKQPELMTIEIKNRPKELERSLITGLRLLQTKFV